MNASTVQSMTDRPPRWAAASAEASMTAEQLAQLRERLKLTQREMAEKLHVHLRTYQQWEYGRRKINAATERLITITFMGAKP